jgi:predicted DNA-binding protein (MmcQ/YjbR family)
MNKLHWISVLLPDAPYDVVKFLLNASFEATKDKRKRQNNCTSEKEI